MCARVCVLFSFFVSFFLCVCMCDPAVVLKTTVTAGRTALSLCVSLRSHSPSENTGYMEPGVLLDE